MADRAFNGRTAVVTGAARGVGRGVALQLAKLGCNIVIADPGPTLSGQGQDLELLAGVRAEVEAHDVGCLAIPTDVADATSVGEMVEQTLDRFGAVDVLINNAGNMRQAWSWEYDEDDFRAIVNVHLQGQFNCLRRVLPGMLERGYGRIVNMTSKGLLGQPLNIAYSAAKSGVIGMTAACAVEIEGSGVTINAFGPSVLTRMSSFAVGMSEQQMKAVPVADAPFVAFLASSAAADINGQIFISRTRMAGVIDLYQRPTPVATLSNPAGDEVMWEFGDLAAAVADGFGSAYMPPGALTRGEAEAYVAKMTEQNDSPTTGRSERAALTERNDTMRRVTVEPDESGRSVVVADEEIPDTGRILDGDPAALSRIAAAIADEDVFTGAQPPDGGAIWHLASIVPNATRQGSQLGGKMDEHGFHVTRTLDLAYVLDDGLVLSLDEGDVTLGAGDLVVMKAARHAWRNYGDTPARFLDVLIPLSRCPAVERAPATS